MARRAEGDGTRFRVFLISISGQEKGTERILEACLISDKASVGFSSGPGHATGAFGVSFDYERDRSTSGD